MQQTAALLGLGGAVVAAVITAVVAIFVNSSSRKSAQVQYVHEQRRAAYAAAFAALTTTQQVLLGILRRSEAQPRRLINMKRRRDGLQRHWARLQNALENQISAGAAVNLMGRQTVTDAMDKVDNDLTFIHLAMVARR